MTVNDDHNLLLLLLLILLILYGVSQLRSYSYALECQYGKAVLHISTTGSLGRYVDLHKEFHRTQLPAGSEVQRLTAKNLRLAGIKITRCGVGLAGYVCN